jgi:hypothetical protein
MGKSCSSRPRRGSGAGTEPGGKTHIGLPSELLPKNHHTEQYHNITKK